MKEVTRIFADAFSTLGEAMQINSFIKLLKQIRPEHLIKAYILSAIFTVFSLVTKNGLSPIFLIATAVLYPFSYIWIEVIYAALPNGLVIATVGTHILISIVLKILKISFYFVFYCLTIYLAPITIIFLFLRWGYHRYRSRQEE